MQKRSLTWLAGLFIIIITLLSSILITNVKAETSPYIIRDTPDNTYDNLEHTQCILPNGKLVIAYISDYYGNSMISIKVFNIDGTLYGETNYQYSSSKDWFDIGIYAVSDTIVYIYGHYVYKVSVFYTGFGVIKYNPSSLATSIVIATPLSIDTSQGSFSYSQVSSMLLYNGKYYFMCATNYVDTAGSNSDTSKMHLLEYTPDSTLGITILKTIEAVDSIYIGVPQWFLSPIDATLAYVMYADSSGGQNYYTISLLAKTQTLIAAVFSSSYAFPTNTDIQARSMFLKGDVIVNGTDRYLYFSYVYPTNNGGITPLPTYTYVNDRMWFNGTIDTIHFQTHISFYYVMHSEYYFDDGKYWSYGFESDKSTVHIYYPFAIDDGNVRVAKATLTAHDWFDPDLAGWSAYTDYYPTDNIPISTPFGLEYKLHFDFLSQYAIGVDDYGGVPYLTVYYGLSLGIVDYSATLVYAPLDTPNLYVNRQYAFTVTAKIGGLGTSGLNVRFLMNGREQSIKVTNSQGKITYLVTFTQTGYYSFTWEIYDPQNDGTIIRYILQDSYVVIPLTGGGVTPPTVITGWSNLLVMWVPVLVFIVTPMLGLAIVGGKYAGGIGMVIGMLGGGFAGIIGGTQLSLLPSYYLWLYLLFMGIALALAVTIGRSGGGSGG